MNTPAIHAWRSLATALCAGALVLGSAAAPTPMKRLHPSYALLDAQGVNVLKSGQPLSTMKTCGQCHDTGYIASHAFHADLGLSDPAPAGSPWDASPGLFGRWDPLRYRYLSQADDERLDLSTAGWLMAHGERVVGGGPATTSRSGQALASLTPDAANPETALLGAKGERTVWNWADSGTMEMNCFLCHLEQPNQTARVAALRAGRFGDANTATLSGLNLVQANGKGWAWNRAAFNAEGLVNHQHLPVQAPSNANCAACHGTVHASGNHQPLTLDACDLSAPQTATTGQVMAAQAMNLSGLNLAGKATLSQPWDVHAERQLQCTDCHHARNNPAHVNRALAQRPAHLRYDPRTLDLGDYLQRPDHDLARGQSAQSHLAPSGKGSMRRCENCHDASVDHPDWLPYVQTHLAALACETCHIPHLHAPAIQSYDWTVLQPDGSPVRSCRGVDGTPGDPRALVTGFDPVLLQRRGTDGRSLLAPYNLITSFYWVYQDAKGHRRPVRLHDLKAAYLEGGAYAPAIVAAFDTNRDGRVDAQELRIDTPQKEAAVTARLGQQGLQQVHMEGQVQPYSINHGVMRGAAALSNCQACHAQASRVSQGLPLAGFAPVLPSLAANTNVNASGELLRREDGGLVYQPVPARDHLYVFGATRIAWVDLIGALAFVGTLLGVSGHGLLRYLAWRQRPPVHEPTRRVQMYDAYRRFWHWLQAVAIMALIATGLVIHRPDLFSAISFPGVVVLHNSLAAVLLANAALSLFYHLATERMREYIPRPQGFVDDAMRQARYYISGIFKGEPHPFEKRPDDRMNPIQKLTYFGILNLLLPLQIATGALMWGVQHWPEQANALGGLPWLAPVHSLAAWLFATFIVGHIYLTTTGATPLEGLRAMVTGEEEVEDHSHGGTPT